MGWGLLPEGNEGSQPSVAVASALCKHLATQEEKEEEEVVNLFDDEMTDLSFASFFTEHKAILLAFETFETFETKYWILKTMSICMTKFINGWMEDNLTWNKVTANKPLVTCVGKLDEKKALH